MVRMRKAAVPELLRIAVLEGEELPTSWFPKRMDGKDIPTHVDDPPMIPDGFVVFAPPTTGPAKPVPVKAAAWKLPPPSSLTIKLAKRVPIPPGVKVTLMVQLELPASVLPHVVVLEKSEAFVPRNVISQMCMGALLEFVKLTG